MAMSPFHIFSEHTFCILNKAHDCAAVVDQIGPPHIVRFCHSKTLNIQVQSLHCGALSSAAGRTGASTLQRFVQFDAVRTGKGATNDFTVVLGHQSINGNLRATSTRYPLYGPPPSDTLVGSHHVSTRRISPVSPPFTTQIL